MSMPGTQSYLIDRFYVRQSTIIAKAELIPVAIIGAGASGSALGLQLAKLGVPMLQLWDGDTVEEHNISNQYYPNSSVGQYKVEALRDIIIRNTPAELLPMVSAYPTFFPDENELNATFVFMAVDGLDNRQTVFRHIHTEYPKVKWVLDTRMGAEYLECYLIDMEDADERTKYWETLQGEPMELPCTGRSVIYNAMCMAGYAVSMFKKTITDERVPFMLGIDLKNYQQVVSWRSDQTVIRI